MCSYNDKETLSTCRFGARAKTIKNNAKINEQKSVKELMILLNLANKKINRQDIIIQSLTKGEKVDMNAIMKGYKEEG